MARISWVRCSAVGCVPAIRSERSRAPESSAVARRFVGTGGLPPSALGGSIGEGTGKVSVPPSEVRIVEELVAAVAELGPKSFVKSCTGGYDGRGQARMSDAAEGPAVRELDARYRAYVAAVDGALAGGAAAGTDGYFRELLPRFTALKETVQHILEMNHATMEAADRGARAMARRSTAVTLAVGAAALLVALWLAWRLPATILAPVRELARAARAVGGGDMEVTVGDPGVAELEPLADSFRKMVAQLRAYRQSSLGELLAAKDLANATVRCLLDPVVVFSRAPPAPARAPARGSSPASATRATGPPAAPPPPPPA